MANRKRGEISAKLQGEQITLKVTMNGMCQFEEVVGKGIFEAFSEMEDQKKIRATSLRFMVWSMMLHSRPDATYAEAGEVMDGFPGGLTGAMNAVGDAISAAFGAPEPGSASGE